MEGLDCYHFWFKRYRRFSYFRRFTFYRLVVKTKKMHHGKISGHAKNWIVITFGLKDIAVLATFTILRLTGWSSKQYI